MFTKPRGTRDILPEENLKRRRAEAIIRECFESFGYGEIATPTFEHLELITAKSGEEIVEHLYAFQDKSGRKLALRPELTAPVMRAYYEAMQKKPKPVRLYYIANCFRYERPQSGRYREFTQAGVELIGSDTPEAEAEVLILAHTTLKKLGLRDFSIEIGHIGILRELLSRAGVEEQNRVLTLIDKGEIKEVEKYLGEQGVEKSWIEKLLAVISLRGGVDVLDKAEEIAEVKLDRFREMLTFLSRAGVEFTVNLGIARGLDYYTGMVFEIYAPKLGAEKQICGGGTYSLAEIFGHNKEATCGFAFGFDRLLLALEKDEVNLLTGEKRAAYIIPVKPEFLAEAFEVARILRERIPCTLEVNRRKLKKALSHASKQGFTHAILVGEEFRAGRVVFRDLIKREQSEVELKEVVNML